MTEISTDYIDENLSPTSKNCHLQYVVGINMSPTFKPFFASTTVQMPFRIFDRKSYTEYPKSDIFDQNKLKNIEVISKWKQNLLNFLKN